MMKYDESLLSFSELLEKLKLHSKFKKLKEFEKAVQLELLKVVEVCTCKC